VNSLRPLPAGPEFATLLPLLLLATTAHGRRLAERKQLDAGERLAGKRKPVRKTGRIELLYTSVTW
jgi:hypothetical protein